MEQPSPEIDIRELVRILIANVGPTVVQAMSATKDRELPARWAAGTAVPGEVATAQLRLGYEVWSMLTQSEGRSVALAWLVGSNELLGGNAPITAINELKAAQVVGAAQAFIEN